MSSDNPSAKENGLSDIVETARRLSDERKKGYREKALKMYPWVCGRCGREFSGKNLRMLTVHHRDHNHDNNPPDGSNWELLCLYCHDNEHSRYIEEAAHGAGTAYRDEDPGDTHQPFANLAELLKKKQENR
ncbi:MAG: YajD family HNH nuclease [Deltaproteobacteria bacterium]|jgi:5-methylcytosine-specific restriction endonuclease McrA|nr:YajD family HNH nuclease [Deltaproteobacteria bacterium]